MSALNVVYGTINKADSQGHYYSISGELLGVEINEKTYALKNTTFFGSKRRKTTVSFSKLMELAAIDYSHFSEVDKMQGWLMSGLPEKPVVYYVCHVYDLPESKAFDSDTESIQFCDIHSGLLYVLTPLSMYSDRKISRIVSSNDPREFIFNYTARCSIDD